MKIKYILLFVLFVAAIPAFAQLDDFVVTFNLGDFGAAWNYPLNDSYDTETYFSLLNIGLKNSITGFGFSFTPVQAFEWADRWQGENESRQVDIAAWSLFNVNLYWNIFDFTSESVNFYLGPFTAINYLFFENNFGSSDFTWRRYIITSGLQAGFKVVINKWFYYNFISIQIGYRRMDSDNRIYVGGSIDLIALITGYFIYLQARASENISREPSR